MNKPSLEARLANHPRLRERIEAILNIAESKVEGPDTADAVEERTILETRKLGREVVQEWANRKSDAETSVYRKNHLKAHIHKKKGPDGTLFLETS